MEAQEKANEINMAMNNINGILLNEHTELEKIIKNCNTAQEVNIVKEQVYSNFDGYTYFEQEKFYSVMIDRLFELSK